LSSKEPTLSLLPSWKEEKENTTKEEGKLSKIATASWVTLGEEGKGLKRSHTSHPGKLWRGSLSLLFLNSIRRALSHL